MIAVDTNLLVYARRQDSPWHDAAYARLAELAEARAAWAIPWPCLHEFLAIVTHPRIYAPPTPLPAALEQVEAWLRASSGNSDPSRSGNYGRLKRVSRSRSSRAPLRARPERGKGDRSHEPA